MPFHLRTLGGLSLERHAPSGVAADLPRTPLAVAAILAFAGPRGMSRDRISSLIWPDSDTDRARNSLRQTVYLLRRVLGDDAVKGTQDLVLVGERVESDVAGFRDAVSRGDHEEAVALYGGPFLDGFHLGRSGEFERWVDEQRVALAHDYRRALEALAEGSEERGDHAAAVRLWRRRAVEEPLSSRVLLRLMRALIAAGDRPAALQAARVHTALVQEEVGCEPDSAVVELIEALQVGGLKRTPRPGAPAPAGATESLASMEPPAPTESAASTNPSATGAAPTPTPAPSPSGAPRPSTPRLPTFLSSRSMRIAGAAVPAMALLVLLALLPGGEVADRIDHRRVEVLPFENLNGDASGERVARIASDWIRQGLAQTGLVDVAPTGLDGWTASGGVPDRSAVRSGEKAPGFYVQGSVFGAGDSLVLQATLLDGRGHQIGALVPVSAPIHDPLVGVERIRQQTMALLATHLNEDLTAWATAGRQPTSFPAYQSFAAGMEAYVRGEWRIAREHYLRASALDTTYNLPLLWASFAAGRAGPVSDSINHIVDLREDRLTPFEAALADYNSATAEEAAYQASARMIAIAPESEWLYVHGRMAHGTMRPHEAIRTLSRADPERGWLDGSPGRGYWMTLAAALKEVGDYEQALEAARRGIRHFPNERTILPLMEGAALAALGRIEELDSLRSTLLVWDRFQAREDLPLAWPAGWAQELSAHGHEEAAREMIDWTLRLYDGLPPALRGQLPKRIEYARLLWTARRYEEARDSLEVLVRERPAHHALRLRLGMAAAKAGDTATALQMLEWLEGSGESPIEPYWRFCILASLGRHEEALGVLRAYGNFRAHAWSGTHIDPSYPLMQEYPPFLAAVAPRDGPAQRESR